MKLNLIEKLNELSDADYKNFNTKIIHTVDNEKVIGVKVPILKKLAKELSKDDALEFLNSEHY